MTRRSPASASACACCASSDPLVVSAMSTPSIAATIATSFGTSLRSSGSPPVRRNFRTPSDAKMRARRAISSNVRISARLRNSNPGPKTSRGMQ